MHMLGHWTAKRSGAHIRVHGYNEDGAEEKFTATEITGPNERDFQPGLVLAWKLDGTPVALVPDFAGIIV